MLFERLIENARKSEPLDVSYQLIASKRIGGIFVGVHNGSLLIPVRGEQPIFQFWTSMFGRAARNSACQKSREARLDARVGYAPALVQQKIMRV